MSSSTEMMRYRQREITLCSLDYLHCDTEMSMLNNEDLVTVTDS